MISGNKTKITLAAKTESGARLSSLYFASLALALFLHLPAMMLFIELGKAGLFFIWLLLIEGTRLNFFFGSGAQTSRAGRHADAARIFHLAPRVFPAAMLSFAYAGAPLGSFVIIGILWAVTEWRCRLAADGFPPAKTLRHLRRTGALTRETDGWLYRLDNGTANLLQKHPKDRTPLTAKLTRVVLPFIIIASGLFLYSQRLGDNFDARAATVGAFCIVIGWLTIPVLIGTRLSRQALDLLAEQGEAAFTAKPAQAH